MYAVPVPSAISVNMLRLRLTSEAQPRWKNGAPAQKTTGVARANCIHIDGRAGTTCSPARWPPIASKNTGSASTRPIQNRRDMSVSSWFGAASALTVSGSRAMPQIGQLPAPCCRICGCMGQV